MLKSTLFLLAVGAYLSSYDPAVSAPKGFEVVRRVPVPGLQFLKPDGQSITLNDYKGMTIVLNVWATWCAPCVKEIPSLDRLADRLDGKKSVVLVVSQDKGGAAIARPFLERLGVRNLSAFADPSGKLSRVLGIRGLPTTFIIGPNGMAVARVEGPIEWDSEQVVRYISSIAH